MPLAPAAYDALDVMALRLHIVMAGLVPAIHVFAAPPKNVDARDKPGMTTILDSRM